MCETKQTKLDSLLEIVNGYTHLSAQDVIDDIGTSSDFKRLGAGFFSKVYCHVDYPEYAIKVCLRTADSWPFFAKYCIDNADNEEVNFILPKIHAFHKLNTRGLYIAVTDRLYPVSFANSIKPERCTEDGLHALRAIASGFDTGFYEIGRIVEDGYARYEDAARLIFSDLSPFCSIDLHGGNVMQDKDNNIIVTDPVSFSPEESSESKINELDCLVKGVEYDGEKALPRNVIQEREHNRLQHRHAEEQRNLDLSLHKFINNISDRVVKNVPVQGIGADLMKFDFAELERKVMVIQAKEDNIPSNAGVVKRNQFLALKLGHLCEVCHAY